MIFLTSIPLWVFPLFLGLLAIALRARSDRRSPVVILYALPLLGLLSFGNTLGFGPIPIGAFVFFWVIGAGLGLRLQPRWTVVREGRFVHLRGEAMTGATILGLFALNFSLGMATGVNPALGGNIPLGLGYASIVGLGSGTLGGRALSISRSSSTRINCHAV